jgi:hypothetical protein
VKAPSPRVFRNEAQLEAACCVYVKRRGGLCKKLSTPGSFGTTGWPDRLFLLAPGITVFVEFKMPGNKVTEIQATRIAEIKARGHYVHVCDNYEAFVEIIESYIGKAGTG